MNILILGAKGQIARAATDLFLANPDTRLTLYLRKAERLKALARSPQVRLVDGDVVDRATLAEAMAGQDVVYANLAGDLAEQARTIVDVLQDGGAKRLIFVTSMGIYDEVPGESYGSILDPYRNAARIIEASDLDYTLLRPAWLNDRDEIAYGTTEKGEPFVNAGASVSRKSVADLIVRTALTPGLHSRASLGVHKK